MFDNSRVLSFVGFPDFPETEEMSALDIRPPDGFVGLKNLIKMVILSEIGNYNRKSVSEIK
jgi:hypothetical protein